MKVGNLNNVVDSNSLDITLSNFRNLQMHFSMMLESYEFHELYEKIIEKLYIFKGEPCTRLSDSEIEEQTLLCIQHRATIKSLARETYGYFKEAKRNYEIWYAEKHEVCQKEILTSHKMDFDSGRRSKSSYGNINKEDIRNRFLVKFGKEYRVWQNDLDKMENLYQFLIETAEDMKDRSISLQSIAKNRKTD